MTDSATPSSAGPPPGGPVCYRHTDRESHIRCQRCSKPICPDCMREAAVGFQCPDCVAEGAKQTRQGRTTYGGTRTANPQATSIALIAANLFVFVMVLATGWRGSPLVSILGLRGPQICDTGAGFVLLDGARCVELGGSALPSVAGGAWWQPLTAAFLHVEIWHIGFNLLVLWLLGPQLEQALGRTRFLAVYLVSALAGSVVVLWAAAPGSLTLGASGAIYGLFAALLVVGLKGGHDVRPLLIWIGINVVLTFTIPNVSWQGHLGGFLGGAAVAAAMVLAPRGPRRPLAQWLVTGAVVVVVLAAGGVRVLTLG